jgi:hypothetical protein
VAQCSAALRSGCCRTLVAHRAALGQDARHRQRDQGYTANAEQPQADGNFLLHSYRLKTSNPEKPEKIALSTTTTPTSRRSLVRPQLH